MELRFNRVRISRAQPVFVMSNILSCILINWPQFHPTFPITCHQYYQLHRVFCTNTRRYPLSTEFVFTKACQGEYSISVGGDLWGSNQSQYSISVANDLCHLKFFKEIRNNLVMGWGGLSYMSQNVKRCQVVKKMSSCEKDVKCELVKHLHYGGGP